mgnify:FL=1|tara:strand:- start:939 stop:1706 length:768 start_codon:yes stop_codon:yes gene_type:complete
MPCIVLNGEQVQPPLSWVEFVGLAVFLFGFGLQLCADLHKWVFRGGCGGDSHRGQFLKTGCWSCSRHPNYCGELLIWWGIWIVSVRPFVQAPWSNLAWLLLTLASPGFTTVLMLFGSGTLMSEQKFDTDYKLTRPEEWEQYLANVPPIIPSFLYCGCLPLPGQPSASAANGNANAADGPIDSSNATFGRRTVHSAVPGFVKCALCCELPCYRAKGDAKFKGGDAVADAEEESVGGEAEKGAIVAASSPPTNYSGE